MTLLVGTGFSACAPEPYVLFSSKVNRRALTFEVGACKSSSQMEAISGTPARIADVAAAAGVGVATVSRVLNGNANVSAPTRARVLEAIQVLNYRPSSVARNLSLRRTLVVGVVIPF